MRKAIITRIFGVVLLAMLFAGAFGVRTNAATVGNVSNLKEVAKDAETGHRAIIIDVANLINGENEKKLGEEMAKILPYGNAIFVTAKESTDYMSTAAKADQIYGRVFGYKVDGVLFIIDMANREIYLYSCGALEKSIKVSDCSSIADNVYSYAGDENYYGCAREAFSQVSLLLETGKIARPMMAILIGLISVFLGSFIMFLFVRGSRKLPVPSTSDLARAGKAGFSSSDLNPVVTHTTKTYSPMASASSGGGGHISGGGGHFGGGGGFSGGGGHGGGHGF